MAILPEVKKHYGKLKLYINGQWVETASNKYFETTNPANDEPIAEAPVASRDEVEKAIATAQELRTHILLQNTDGLALFGNDVHGALDIGGLVGGGDSGAQGCDACVNRPLQCAGQNWGARLCQIAKASARPSYLHSSPGCD